jgi:hypothetical protein
LTNIVDITDEAGCKGANRHPGEQIADNCRQAQPPRNQPASKSRD